MEAVIPERYEEGKREERERRERGETEERGEREREERVKEGRREENSSEVFKTYFLFAGYRYTNTLPQTQQQARSRGIFKVVLLLSQCTCANSLAVNKSVSYTRYTHVQTAVFSETSKTTRLSLDFIVTTFH